MRINTTPEIFANLVRDYITSLINTGRHITITEVGKISLQDFQGAGFEDDHLSVIRPITENITHVIIKVRLEPSTPVWPEGTTAPDDDDSNFVSYATGFYFQITQIALERINVSIIYKPVCEKYLEMVMQEIKDTWEEPEDIRLFGQPISSAVIRKLLNDALSDDALKELCYDHFRPVYDEFGSQTNRKEKIHSLIEYCERHLQFDKLLTRIKELNPEQYSKFFASKESPHAHHPR